MAESKAQKVARQAATRPSVGTCPCGGALLWAQVIERRARRAKVCDACGTLHPKADG